MIGTLNVAAKVFLLGVSADNNWEICYFWISGKLISTVLLSKLIHHELYTRPCQI